MALPGYLAIFQVPRVPSEIKGIRVPRVPGEYADTRVPGEFVFKLHISVTVLPGDSVNMRIPGYSATHFRNCNVVLP